MLCVNDALFIFLTESLHGLHQFEGEWFVSGKVLQHASDLVVPRPDDVAPVNALYVVAHADHLHLVCDAALSDPLASRERTGSGKKISNKRNKKSQTYVEICVFDMTVVK